MIGRRALPRLLGLLCLAGLARIATAAIVPVKAAAAQILLDHAFAASLASHRPQKPWPWADMAPAARLDVPRLGLHRIVLDAGSGQAMAFGPTWLPGGAAPGRPGGIVIAAHRDTHFRFLERLRVGDRLTLQGIDGKTRVWRVTGAEVTRWDRFALPDQGGDQLALATCYPFGALGHGPLRYVVHAVPA